jgi:hypothetical protein
MSYGFDLVRLPPGTINRDEAYRKTAVEQERAASERNGESIGPLDPAKERAKQSLAASLMARHPSFKLFQRNYARLAKDRSIDEAEARRRYRTVELNDREHTIQIVLFDDAAGVSFSLGGDGSDGREALRIVWDCLEILEAEGGLSSFDSQMDRLVDLGTDFEVVAKATCKSG